MPSSEPDALAPYDLRCEHLRDPLGLDIARPRLSWKLRCNRSGARQVAYRILVTQGGGATLWDSGRVESAESVLVEYGGPVLGSGERASWTVTVWDELGIESTGPPAFWEAGLLEPAAWGRAEWVTLPRVPFERLDFRPSPQLRRTFALASGPVRGRVFVTALGLYRLSINGRRVGSDALTPGWTEYEERLQYQAYDVTELLVAGENVVSAVLGDGWHSGCLPYSTKIRNRLGVEPQLRLRLLAELADGSTAEVVSDADWRGCHGPILASDRYRGELYDARQETPGWDTAAFDAAAWSPVVIGAGTDAPLVGMRAEPVRPTQQLRPVAITEPLLPGNAYVVDFGQNLVGWCRLQVEGPPGMEISLRHGEMLDADGTLYTTNLWDATMQSDTYITKGGKEVWEPSFTIHGFRYVEILGYPGPPTEDSLTAIVAHTDMRPTGTFTCSNEMVNQLVRNIDWCQRGNFVEVPTDCPQRAERLGWLGDAELFAPTGAYLYDVAPLFTRWLVDIRGAQSPEGAFPNIVPREGVMALPQIGAPGWGDAGVILPWLMYEVYGDVRVLEEHYESMAAWVEFLRKASPELIYDPGHAWGDWLAVPPDQYAATTKDVLGTLYFAHSTDLVARAAAVLGRERDAKSYRSLFDDIAAAFRDRFVSEDGTVSGGTQTVHALALRFGVLDEEAQRLAGEHLVADIAARGGHLSTGIVGTAHLLPALSESDRLDVAYQLLENETFPSWGYSIRNGATTVWERWDGWTEENGFQTPQMNSFNHYAIGSVGEWLFRTVGGIVAEAPGYARVRIAPRPGGSLTWADARYDSVRGPIRCRWSRGSADAAEVAIEVELPANVTGVLDLPGCDAVELPSGVSTHTARLS